jgi:hypothetical protein
MTRPGVAHYLFNFVKEDASSWPALREEATGFLRVRMWGIDADERHAHALAAGDLVLLYLGAPDREFIGRAELASGSMTGHRRRHRRTQAIRPAACC